MARKKIKEKLTKFFKGFQDRITVEKDKWHEVHGDKEVKVETIGWIQKYLYPYAIDLAPLRRSDLPEESMPIGAPQDDRPLMQIKPGEVVDILTTDRFQFPLEFMDKKPAYMNDIRKPITIQKEEILKEMYEYRKEFPVKIIPHVTDTGEVVDLIHQISIPKPVVVKPKTEACFDSHCQVGHQRSESKSPQVKGAEPAKASAPEPAASGGINLLEKDPTANLALTEGTPNLKHEDIETALKEVTSDETAQLIGLICHLAYWRVFNHISTQPLDPYHTKQIFIRITQIQQNLQKRAVGKKASTFVSFTMPMIVLAIRFEVENIFKSTYEVFFSKEIHEKIAMKYINDVITYLIDPNIYYSRLSFFESGRQAIDIKYNVSANILLRGCIKNQDFIFILEYYFFISDSSLINFLIMCLTVEIEALRRRPSEVLYQECTRVAVDT